MGVARGCSQVDSFTTSALRRYDKQSRFTILALVEGIDVPIGHLGGHHYNWCIVSACKAMDCKCTCCIMVFFLVY